MSVWCLMSPPLHCQACQGCCHQCLQFKYYINNVIQWYYPHLLRDLEVSRMPDLSLNCQWRVCYQPRPTPSSFYIIIPEVDSVIDSTCPSLPIGMQFFSRPFIGYNRIRISNAMQWKVWPSTFSAFFILPFFLFFSQPKNIH